MIYFDLDGLIRQRTVSFGSMKSTTSDTPDIIAGTDDDTTVEIKNKKFSQPFIFKILKLNLPEINWIILGCISSILFGAITPVRIFIENNDLKLFVLVIFVIFF